MILKKQLKPFFTEYWSYMAINAACELELFDKIFEGQNSMDKLVQFNNWNLIALNNLVSFLTTNRLLIEDEKQALSVSPKGNLLRKKNPDGLYYACLNWASEQLIAWQNLKYSIETGNSSFENIYDIHFFDYLNENPEKLHRYQKAMYEYARDDYKKLPDLIDFSRHKSVMDVGGGYGAVLENIKKKNQNIDCILFDMKQVIQNVNHESIKKVAGNFFESVPQIADAIILSRVLHDWNDQKAKVILVNCFEALPMNGYLYVIENCTDKTQVNLSLLTLNMIVMCQSFERSSNEYIELCIKGGFKFKRRKQLNKLQTILIFTK